MTDPRLQVVSYNPGRTAKRWFALLIVGAALIAGAYYFGAFQERTRLGNPASTITRLEAEVLSLQQKNRELSQTSVIATKGAEVDRLANENVRKDIMNMRDHIAGLEEANSFYRSLMSPQDGTKGIHIGSVEIVPKRRDKHYKLKVVIQQIAKTHRLVKGNMRVTIDGTQLGKPVSFAVAELSDKTTQEDIALRFKYFQTFESELAIPDDFTPYQINIAIKTRGKKSVSVNKTLAWLVEDNLPRLSVR